MTHSLHRRGSKESLKNDYVFLATPAIGINEKGCKNALIKILDIVYNAGVANIGSYEKGTILDGVSVEEIKENLSDTSRVRCCFDDIKKLKEVLAKLKEENLGISITISGLIEEINKICKELDITPHTINFSAGVHGNISLLPEEKILEITTMCGHGMVSPTLVKKMAINVRKGKCSLEEAAKNLASPCVCGIFNPTRAKKILKDYIEEFMKD